MEAASEASLTAPPLPSEVKQDLEQALRALPDPQRRLRLDGAAAAAGMYSLSQIPTLFYLSAGDYLSIHRDIQD